MNWQIQIKADEANEEEERRKNLTEKIASGFSFFSGLQFFIQGNEKDFPDFDIEKWKKFMQQDLANMKEFFDSFKKEIGLPDNVYTLKNIDKLKYSEIARKYVERLNDLEIPEE